MILWRAGGNFKLKIQWSRNWRIGFLFCGLHTKNKFLLFLLFFVILCRKTEASRFDHARNNIFILLYDGNGDYAIRNKRSGYDQIILEYGDN